MKDPGESNYDFETSVPTDLTISSFSDDNLKKNLESVSKKTGVDKQRKEYIRELQLLNLELSRKNAFISSLKIELNSRTKDLEEKLKNSERDKQMFQTKLQTQLRLTEEQSKNNTTLIYKELNEMREQIRNWDEIYEKIMCSLENFNFNGKDVAKIKAQPTQALDLHNYIKLKIHELIWKYKKENDEFKLKISNSEAKLSRLQEKYSHCQEECERTVAENRELHDKVKVKSQQITNFKSRIEHGNFAQENFSRVKEERDRTQKELLELKQILDKKKMDSLQLVQEKEKANEEKSDVLQKLQCLERTHDCLCEQLSDATQKWGELQDVAHKLKSELSYEKSSKEELLQQHIDLRNKLKAEYQKQVQKETNKAVTMLSLRYENEIKTLTESKFILLRSKEESEVIATELKKKYEELYKRFHDDSLSESNHFKTIQKELDETKLQHQKLLISYNKLEVNHKGKCLELEKAQIKLKLTEDELQHLRKSSEDRLRLLETELGTSRARLDIFDKMENELDEVIAEVAHGEQITEETLKVIADQISLPAKARHSFNKCVHLTQKAIQLERSLTSRQEELDSMKEKNSTLTNELSRLNQLFEQVGQPYSYLICTVREHESNMRDLRVKLDHLEDNLQKVQQEKEFVIVERNNLAKDLDKLLGNREELTKIKKELTLLQGQHPSISQSSVLLGTKPKTKASETQKKTIKGTWK